MIPHIIHITSKNTNFNTIEQYTIDKWKSMYQTTNDKDYEIKIWTDLDNIQFINEFFPYYKSIIDNFQFVIEKIDFIRLLYLYHFGGIYVDLDVFPLKDITCLLEYDLILCYEPNKFNEFDKLISNAIMISSPKNPFIKQYIDTIIENSIIKSSDINSVLYLTGPCCLTTLYNNYYDKSNILVLDHYYFLPLSLNEITENMINNSCKYAFMVHLFNGSWWEESDNLSLSYLQFIELTSTMTFPKISCLCITQNNMDLVSQAIHGFNKQIYPNKELIIIYQETNKYIKELYLLVSEVNTGNIFLFCENNNLSLGELRNISIEKSTGDYIIQWDDDDIYSHLRLYEQFYYTCINNKNGCILDQWIIQDDIKNNKYLSGFRLWEGSILYKKSEIKVFYPLFKKAEDTIFIKSLQNLFILHKPELYTYRLHNNNTWDYTSHMRGLLNVSTLLIKEEQKPKYINKQFLQLLNLSTSVIPPIIHRLLLYDNTYPSNALEYINKFHKIHPEFYHICWTNDDIQEILTDNEKLIYNSLVNIQKSDYARYIVLNKFGGIYVDYDIDVLQSIYPIYISNKYKNTVLFTEKIISSEFTEITKSYPIRNNIPESPIRIANYIIMAQPNSLTYVINMCNERIKLPIKTDYDIIYTTGPDIMSTIFNNNLFQKFTLIDLELANTYFKHICLGHWRNNFFQNLNLIDLESANKYFKSIFLGNWNYC